MPSKKRGGVQQDCPQQKGKLVAWVLEATTKEGIKGLTLTARNTAKETSRDGFAEWAGLDPGGCEVKLELGQLAATHVPRGAGMRTENVRAGDETFCLFQLEGPGDLAAKLTRADTHEPVGGIAVTAKGAMPERNATSVGATGLADFGASKPGNYTLTVALTEEQARKYEAPKEKKGQTVVTRQKTTVDVELEPRARLRIVLVGRDGKALANVAWKVTSPLQKSGMTGGDGLIELEDFPYSANRAELEVKLTTPPRAIAPVLAAVVPPEPPYPPPLEADDWKDTDKPVAAEVLVKWALEVKRLEVLDEGDAVTLRLENLGFPAADEQLKTRSVRAYQKLYLNDEDGSGNAVDIKDDIKTRHDTL
ncbi:carboxypeptidase regulatory-like domain-containing protein [Archangium violaceum]|uniref:carboxypeptidase-like regulatory domain-containing protein n=1 Tax=Archangium violaceum TaxID=83451 RepID=UPI00193B795A|nr:carboxypeptidase-like regulatory domain-containing protein [Archangium violaceum]QRK13127.1 carboxypeptidase regulatory-like domain-containing protein [Archangium violaceum]